MALRSRTRSNECFDLFKQAGENILRAARLLEKMLESWPEENDLAREILLCEQEGDRLAHRIFGYVNDGAKIPIASADVYSLVACLDDVVDDIEQVADFLLLYRVEAPMDQAAELARVLTRACERLSVAVPVMRDLDAVKPILVEINRLENEGDRIFRDGVASLFSDGIDPMFVIRWKDIFSWLERAVDGTEKAAHVIETIAAKHRR